MGKERKWCCVLWKVSLAVLCFAVVSVIGASYACADTAPNGSYKKTCTGIYYNESSDRITSASCKKMDGKSNTTQLKNANQCISNGGDISNCDGTLECTGVNLPSVGSYQRSCWCCRMVGSTLGCYCNPKKGKSKWTTLSNASTYSDIWNDNGKLKGK
ncbi:MAG TPA: hypothetical protein DDZ40_05625 [Deltaproteobacteria bacterium]|nr:hypothetical protein [Deltaproteobacteria bacterium]